MLNRSAEWGSEHLTLPRIMPSILLTWHLITSGLAFIITNAKPDFVPFEDSRSSNRSIIIRQNNYVALKGRSKKNLKLLGSAFLCQELACCGCCVRQHFTPVWSHFILRFSTHCGLCSHHQEWLSRTTNILPHSFLPSSPSSHFSIRTRASARMRHVEKSEGALGGAGGWAGNQEEKITGSCHLPNPSWSSHPTLVCLPVQEAAIQSCLRDDTWNILLGSFSY